MSHIIQSEEIVSGSTDQRKITLGKSGDPEAQFEAGITCINDLRDEDAVRYFKLAADQGYARAQSMLSWGYFHGLGGLQQDEQMAFSLADASAKQGDPFGEYLLGLYYANGIGVDKNNKAAAKWYKLSADQGNAMSKADYGWLLIFGDNIPHDYERGCALLKEAYDEGVDTAAPCIARFYLDRDDTKNAAKWCRLAGETGDAKGWVMLGVLYENGDGVRKNLREAFKCYENAKNLNDAEGKFHLSRMYLDGRGTKQNTKQGIHWLTESAEQGYVKAQMRLACCYIIKEYVEYNFEEGIKWFTAATNQGDEDAAFFLEVLLHSDMAEEE